MYKRQDRKSAGSEDHLDDAEWAEVPVQSGKAKDGSLICNRGVPSVAKTSPKLSRRGSEDRSNTNPPSTDAVVDLRPSSGDDDDDDSSVDVNEDDFVEVAVQDVKTQVINRANKVDSKL